MLRVNVTLPVLNEQAQLAASIRTLQTFLCQQPDIQYEVVIADNGSTDGTLSLAQDLSELYDNVIVIHLEQQGRGRALKRVWTESEADVFSYMDVDLSTDLGEFTALVKAVHHGGYDLATGSRLHSKSRVQRGWFRRWISRSYNCLVKWHCATTFTDAQCGFKAISKPAARQLLPLVKDDGWFFDTELLVIAEHCGYRIFDLPVTWVEDTDSRVKIISTAWTDFKGLLRLRRAIRNGQYAHLTKC
jgi:glycosyltransferase involved in cell wall biosynthesis